MNNTKIARQLIEAYNHPVSPESHLKDIAKELICAHNAAVKYGLLQLPFLDFIEVSSDENTECKIIDIEVNFKSGMAEINDVFNIKQEWGADEVYFLNSGRIAFEFKI